MSKNNWLFLGFLSVLAAIWGYIQPARAQEPQTEGTNQAGLVISFGSELFYAVCISFEDQTITGYQLLQRSGLKIASVFDPHQGAAICQVEAVGCSIDNCFCAMPSYWSYWNLVDGSWIYAVIGASARQVRHGDVDGWAWGQTGEPPQRYSFEQICGPGAERLPLPVSVALAPQTTEKPGAIIGATSTLIASPTSLEPFILTETERPGLIEPVNPSPPALSIPDQPPTTIPQDVAEPVDASPALLPYLYFVLLLVGLAVTWFLIRIRLNRS
jgi:hypothetical protein